MNINSISQHYNFGHLLSGQKVKINLLTAEIYNIINKCMFCTALMLCTYIQKSSDYINKIRFTLKLSFTFYIF